MSVSGVERLRRITHPNVELFALLGGMTLVVGTSRDAVRVVLELHDTHRCVSLSSLANFKVAGELFVVLGDGQRETPRVWIRHTFRVRFRFLRTRPAVVRIIQA
jgi:hypothetical protein